MLPIGIDLGTTNSLCAVFQNGRPVLVKNADNQVLTPSVVAVLEDGQILVGLAALELRVTQPHRTVSCFKRWMGTDKQLALGDKTFSPIELSSLVLKSLKMDAEHYLRNEVTEAIITVPAYFNDQQRNATRQAGQLAGLTVLRILNEPTAAALTYGFHDRNSDKRLLIIDLGGGTFDVTLMEVYTGTLEIIASAGEGFLGGEDFTESLVAAVLRAGGLQLEIAELHHPLQVARLRQLCEVAKQSLALEESVAIHIPLPDGTLAENGQQVEITREEFRQFCQSLTQRIKGPINKVMRDVNLTPTQIDDVIFVGGATRMVLIHEMISDLFGKPPLITFNPDEVVALGAAVQCALIGDEVSVEDLVMTDVCPHTLGIEIVKCFGSVTREGYFSPIIHRNTTIPVSREHSFSTVNHNQAEVRIHIFQGENRRVEKNLKLGELKVTGIPPGPAGQVFQVRFSYDVNGILEVESYVPGLEKKFRIVLTHYAKHLDPRQIQEAIERLQKLKYYPRDDQSSQRLLRFCERIVGEVSLAHRAPLEAEIDSFQGALDAGDSEQVQSNRQSLLQFLSHLGIEYEADHE